jgi:hypothetical protein
VATSSVSKDGLYVGAGLLGRGGGLIGGGLLGRAGGNAETPVPLIGIIKFPFVTKLLIM